jgi:phosphomethylpyrimidine synthase
MKISQEVREFARLNPPPSAGEGRLAPGLDPGSSGERGLVEAEQGMAEMSERYRAGGNELYIGANGREHD